MEATNFIENIINKDLESGKVKSVYTRFPPSQTDICISDTPKVCA